jgi:CDP-4-dehydro-6-deoxyglucose reductase
VSGGAAIGVVESGWDETAELRAVVVRAGEPARRYASPGQYLRIGGAGGLSMTCAIANAPGTPYLELLLKRRTAGGAAVGGLVRGVGLSLSLPAGPGFPVGEHQGRDILLLACGSAIAPMRACIQYILGRRGRYGAVRLYYGAREPAFAYAHEHHYWRAKGIELVPVVSCPGSPQWKGQRGHVQQALGAHPPSARNAVAYACGMPAMVAEVTAALERLGFDRRSVFLNY